MNVAASAQNYSAYAGKRLIVNFPSHPHYDIAIKLLPEFTKKTGIIVKVDQLEYQAMRAKQALELSKPSGDYDLISYVVTSRPDYVAMNKLYSLDRFFTNPQLQMKNYQKSDFVKAYLTNIGYEKKLYGIPFGAETSILGYRKKKKKKHNLSPPQTYKELIQQACYLNKIDPNISGITSRGASGHHLTHAFLLHLAPHGGRILDENMLPTLNNEAGIKAAYTLKKLFSCAPKGVHSFRFGEMKNSFLQGKTAFYLDSIIVAGETQNATKSKISHKVAWIPHPKGVRHASQTGGFGLAIPKNGHAPEAAFLLLQWLTSPEIDLKIALMGGNPSRLSTYYNKKVIEKYPYMPIFGNALKNADPHWRPIIPEWNEMNKKIGNELSKAMQNQKEIPEALNDAAKFIKKILDKAGYYAANN